MKVERISQDCWWDEPHISAVIGIWNISIRDYNSVCLSVSRHYVLESTTLSPIWLYVTQRWSGSVFLWHLLTKPPTEQNLQVLTNYSCLHEINWCSVCITALWKSVTLLHFYSWNKEKKQHCNNTCFVHWSNVVSSNRALPAAMTNDKHYICNKL